MKPSFLLVGGLLLGLTVLGAGCSARLSSSEPSTERPVYQAPTSTSDASATSSTAAGKASRLLSLEGTLPHLGRTTLSLTLGDERIMGQYEAGSRSGAMYGTVSTTRANPVEFSLYVGDEEAVQFRGSYEEASGRVVGTAVYMGAMKEQPVTFLPRFEAEGAKIELKKIEQRKELARGVSCHTTLEYPVIQASPYIPAERATVLNQQIRQFLGETSTTTLEGLVEASQKDCIELQSEFAADMETGDEPSGINDYEYETMTLVTRNERGLLSFVYSTYFYTGGAHPNSVTASQVFDLATGKTLALTDLVRPDKLEAWIQREQQELLKTEQGEWLFEPEISKEIADGSLKGEAASSTAAYNSKDQWYLSKNTLVRYYQSYEIAPYAAGMPSTELPFSAWRDLAVPGVDRWFR